MKRTVAWLAVTLITALMLFSVSSSAKMIDISVKENTYSCDVVSVYQNERSDTAVLQKADTVAAPATEVDPDEIKEDGINLRVATIWIVSISVVVFAAILAVVIYLAKKNKDPKQ